MKIIFATDPIHWPLTGIGKYTFELAKRFNSAARVSDIRFFNMGRWQKPADILKFGHEDARARAEEDSGKASVGRATAGSWMQRGFGLARRTLARNPLAVKVYSGLTPYVYRQRLKPFAPDYLYHGPNFMLPRYDGRKVVTFHDLSVLKYPEFHPQTRVALLEPEMSEAARNADHIITVSEAVRREVIDYFTLPEDRVTAVPLASSINQAAPEPDSLARFLARHDLRKGQFLLFVSSIEPRKNVARILDAYESLPQRFRMQYPLVLTGSSGWKSGNMLERIKSLSGAGAVRYLGYTTDTELHCLYHGAGGLVFPSIYEGFGLPIIEAQAVGLPVVTSNISCMPEVSGGASLLVDPFDVDAIKDALERIMLDEELRQELREKGYENASRLSWDTTADRTLDVYGKL